MTRNSLPQPMPSDLDVFVASPAAPVKLIPADLVAIFEHLLAQQPEADPSQRDRWAQRLAYWRHVAAMDAEVQREGWAAVRQGLGMDDGVRR